MNILEKIYHASFKFLYPLTAIETYKNIVEESLKLVDAEYGSIFLKKHGKLYRVYSSVPQWSQVQPHKKGNSYRALTHKKVIVIPQEVIQKQHPEFTNLHIKSFVVIPLTHKETSIGVLTLQSKKEEFFTSDKVRVLKLFGSMASLAIHKVDLYSKTKQALESRDLFMSLAAHELRTPLTVVYTYIQLVQKTLNQGEIPDPKWITMLKGKTKELSDMVDTLLEIDQIRSGKFTYDYNQYLLRTIIDEVIESFRAMHPSRKLSLHSDIHSKSAFVRGDENRLKQVFTNLLNNAVKFSPPDTHIRISMTVGGRWIKVSVEDQGSGISKEHIPFVFEGFYRGSSGVEGRGLGLYLARKIVSAHKGTIRIAKTTQKGTTFEVKLPIFQTHVRAKGDSRPK